MGNEPRAWTCLHPLLSFEFLASGWQRGDTCCHESCAFFCSRTCLCGGSVVPLLLFFFFLALMTHFNLYISSHGLATRLSRSFICLYLTQLFSPLPHGAREGLRHSVQLEAWMAACLPWSSAWVLASFLMSADSLSLCQVDTMSGLSILRRC